MKESIVILMSWIKKSISLSWYIDFRLQSKRSWVSSFYYKKHEIWCQEEKEFDCNKRNFN